MKTKFSFLALGTVLVIATAWTSPGYQYEAPSSENHTSLVAAPPSGEFSFFRTHKSGRGVANTWGVSGEAGVVGFKLQKTYEDPTDPYAIWEDVEFIPCNGSRSYKSTDANVFPGSISYKVTGQRADGTTIESGISTVRIVAK